MDSSTLLKCNRSPRLACQGAIEDLEVTEVWLYVFAQGPENVVGFDLLDLVSYVFDHSIQ